MYITNKKNNYMQENVIVLKDEVGNIDTIIRYRQNGLFEIVRNNKKVNLEELTKVFEDFKNQHVSGLDK